MSEEGGARGLLSFQLKSVEEIEKEEAFNRARAEQIKSDIERQRQLSRAIIPPTPLLFTSPAELLYDREQRLLDFAVKRKLPLVGDWRSIALYFAAMEHPDIAAPPKKRGAPPKKHITGLLSGIMLGLPQDPDAQMVEEIDQIIEQLKREGRAPHQLIAIEVYMRRTDPLLRPESRSGNYYSKIKQLERKIGKARKRLGKPLKRGPKKRIIPANKSR